jgi:hypothetical protein
MTVILAIITSLLDTGFQIEKLEVAMGFEPMNNGFADRPLEPLGYATKRAESGNEEISTL